MARVLWIPDDQLYIVTLPTSVAADCGWSEKEKALTIDNYLTGIRISRAFGTPLSSTPATGSPHQSRHAVARTAHTGGPQLPVHPGGAVPSFAVVVHRLDVCQELRIIFCSLLPPCRHEWYPLSVTPTVRQRAGVLMRSSVVNRAALTKTGVRSAQEQYPERELRPLSVDERVAHFVSLANQCVRSSTWPLALNLSGHLRSFLSGSFFCQSRAEVILGVQTSLRSLFGLSFSDSLLWVRFGKRDAGRDQGSRRPGWDHRDFRATRSWGTDW